MSLEQLGFTLYKKVGDKVIFRKQKVFGIYRWFKMYEWIGFDLTNKKIHFLNIKYLDMMLLEAIVLVFKEIIKEFENEK